MVSSWSLSDNKSPQISRTLFNILAYLNNVVVWTISTCPLISKSSSPFTNPLEIILSAPITIGITVIFMFYNVFNSLANSRYWLLLLLSLLLLFYSMRDFHTSGSWWSFTGVLVTASLKSPGLFSAFWPILKMLWFGWSRFVLQFPIVSALFLCLWGPFQARHLQLDSLLPSCSTGFLVLWQGPSTCLSFRIFYWAGGFSLCDWLERQNSHYASFLVFFFSLFCFVLFVLLLLLFF